MNSSPKSEVTFVCISDTHTHTENIQLPPGDVLIHAGDFTYTGRPEEVSEFNEFLAKQNFSHKIVISGNHDLTFDLLNYENLCEIREEKKDKLNPVEIKKTLKNCIYLEDSSCNVYGYNIYGSPWQITYDDWGFFADSKKAVEVWSRIPSDTDILVTHNPPVNIMDRCEDGTREGCPILRKNIEERIKPKVHVFGHVHEGYGMEKKGETIFINASICDEKYKPVNAPIVFKLPIKL